MQQVNLVGNASGFAKLHELELDYLGRSLLAWIDKKCDWFGIRGVDRIDSVRQLQIKLLF